jgi:hypothetical protein
MVEGHKVYMTHELGHNLGLTHAGSMVCNVEGGAVSRSPKACRPDWCVGWGDGCRVRALVHSAAEFTLKSALRSTLRRLPLPSPPLSRYGDFTTFMGGASSLTLPAYYRLQQVGTGVEGWRLARRRGHLLCRTSGQAVPSPMHHETNLESAPLARAPPPPLAPMRQGWLSQRFMRTVSEVGRQVTLVLRDANARAPPGGAFAPGNPAAAAAAEGAWGPGDVLVARVPVNASLPGGYACPCTQGSCAGVTTCHEDAQCGGGPCCVDEACADGGFEYYYIEFARAPVPGDFAGPPSTGVAVRLAGKLKDCESTRLVATHAEGGVPKYVLDRADPAGKLPGSWFEDPLRRVVVRVDGMGTDWAQVSILRY